nr:GNAT family N-acetyltransferase [uncultured Acetatifactor sp.]
MNNLCVMPAYRHNGIGEELLRDAFKAAGALYCITLNTA